MMDRRLIPGAHFSATRPQGSHAGCAQQALSCSEAGAVDAVAPST